MSEKQFYPPFITGSVALGSATETSDVDLVLYISDPQTRKILRKPFSGTKNPCIMYGNLNIILCDTMEKYHFWKKALEECQEQQQKIGKLLTKPERCKIHEDVARLLEIEYMGEYSSRSSS